MGCISDYIPALFETPLLGHKWSYILHVITNVITHPCLIQKDMLIKKNPDVSLS